MFPVMAVTVLVSCLHTGYHVDPNLTLWLSVAVFVAMNLAGIIEKNHYWQPRVNSVLMWILSFEEHAQFSLGNRSTMVTPRTIMVVFSGMYGLF